MALILSIETATNICSICISKDGSPIAIKENTETNAHSSQLTILIQQALDEANISTKEIDAIAISKGPGSYTGLRIGTSVAKGICYANSIPLIAVDTLHSLTLAAKEMIKTDKQKYLLVPMLDARRMEVYMKVFNNNLDVIEDTKPQIIDENSYKEYFESNTIYFFGNGAEKCKPVLNHQNALFIDNIELSAKWMSALAEQAYSKQAFESVAYFEPFYLKEFQATTPSKNQF